MLNANLAKGAVAQLAAERSLPGVGRPDMVDQVAGGFKMAAAHHTREYLLLLLSAPLVIPALKNSLYLSLSQ
jgi:hypothetical protein